jgi:hypothetical protein
LNWGRISHRNRNLLNLTGHRQKSAGGPNADLNSLAETRHSRSRILPHLSTQQQQVQQSGQEDEKNQPSRFSA